LHGAKLQNPGDKNARIKGQGTRIKIHGTRKNKEQDLSNKKQRQKKFMF